MAAFYEQGWFKYLKNLIIGAGAAVVLVGALMKLLYHPWADLALKVGMLTEAGIFLLLGLLPPHKDYYWEKIYPGLNKAGGTVEGVSLKGIGAGAGGGSVTQDLDKMLEESNVETDMIKRLGDNLAKLSSNVESMHTVADTAGATSEFTNSAKAAAEALDSMKGSYQGASEAMALLANAQADTAKYHEEVQKVSGNLQQLNAIYELELQDTNNHLKAMNKFYGGLTDAMNDLNDSLEDTKRYKEQIGHLASNLTQLNQVYGNMLTAMRTGAGG